MEVCWSNIYIYQYTYILSERERVKNKKSMIVHTHTHRNTCVCGYERSYACNINFILKKYYNILVQSVIFRTYTSYLF